jgi:hypothetical protein
MKKRKKNETFKSWNTIKEGSNKFIILFFVIYFYN